MREALDRVRQGEDDPRCDRCGGILKSATVMFGESLLPGVIDRAMLAAAEADVFLAIGTSLAVFPVANTVRVAARSGARVVIINAEPTAFDGLAAAVFHERIADVLPAVIP
jgi:NAD-dependent deacetylase